MIVLSGKNILLITCLEHSDTAGAVETGLFKMEQGGERCVFVLLPWRSGQDGYVCETGCDAIFVAIGALLSAYVLS